MNEQEEKKELKKNATQSQRTLPEVRDFASLTRSMRMAGIFVSIVVCLESRTVTNGRTVRDGSG
jgi:hypothetical protein